MLNRAKHFIKRALQYVAANYGQHTRDCNEPQLIILMYHRILPRDDRRAQLEEPGMMVTPETFDMHMNIIEQTFPVMQLSQWIHLKNTGQQLPKRCCAITFDDGWLDNYEYAFPILQKYHLPATIFLVSEMMGTDTQFWPERLALMISDICQLCPEKWSHVDCNWLTKLKTNYKFSSKLPDKEQFTNIVQQLKIHTDQEIHVLLSKTQHLIPNDEQSNSSATILNWHQMQTMIDTGLIEAGSHTCNHIRLNNSQSSEKLASEIIESKKSIEKHTGKPVHSFCYPNGDHCLESEKLVMETYDCAVTTNSNWNSRKTNPHLLHRIALHEDISADKTAFLAKLSNWM